MIKLEKIIDLAKKNGLGISLFGRDHIVDQGDGTSRLVKSTELTIFGQNLVNFARAIEREVLADDSPFY